MRNSGLDESQAGIKIAGRIGCGEENPLTLLVEMQIDTDTMVTSMDISFSFFFFVSLSFFY